MRSLEEVLRLKRRQAEDLKNEIITLEAAKAILDSEPEPKLPIAQAPGVPAVEPKRWP